MTLTIQPTTTHDSPTLGIGIRVIRFDTAEHFERTLSSVLVEYLTTDFSDQCDEFRRTQYDELCSLAFGAGQSPGASGDKAGGEEKRPGQGGDVR